MNEFSQIVLRRRLRRRFPLGMFAGLLAACLATLLGAACGHDPLAVFQRAIISGVAAGILMSIGMSVVRVANMEPDRKEEPAPPRTSSRTRVTIGDSVSPRPGVSQV